MPLRICWNGKPSKIKLAAGSHHISNGADPSFLLHSPLIPCLPHLAQGEKSPKIGQLLGNPAHCNSVGRCFASPCEMLPDAEAWPGGLAATSAELNKVESTVRAMQEWASIS